MTEKYRIEVNEGEEVSAVHHRADSDDWIFFCHGFGSNKKGSYENRCNIMAKNGWNAVRFDFRGNGESDSDFIEQNLSSRIEDLKSVVNHFNPDKCVVFGSSFGGKVAFHFSAQDRRVNTVIGKAPVTYNDIMSKFQSVIENKGRFEYIDGKPIDERFFEDFDQYSFEEVIESLDIPVMIFHGSVDTTVHTEKSYKALKELDTDVHFIKFKGEKHSFTDEAESEMMNNIVNFLERSPE